MIHHSKFGTAEDAEFLNFVTPRRYWMTFIPFAVVINFSDFVFHRPSNYTKSRWISLLVALMYHVPYTYLTYRLWGGWFTLLVFLSFTQLGFHLDRLRQFTEHNLMPLDNLNGSRSFGFGFWECSSAEAPGDPPVTGSTTWSQHPLVSAAYVAPPRPWFVDPWPAQPILHSKPVIGFPILWWNLLRQSYSLMSTAPDGIEAGVFAATKLRVGLPPIF